MTESKVTIHMVSSLDGFIASKDGNIDWMQTNDKYENGTTLSQEFIDDFLKSIDCYVMGSRTYEHALKLGWPYGDVPVVVLTRRNLTSDRKNVNFYQGDLNHLVNMELKSAYQNIWMVGGAALAKDFIIQGLTDEIIISFIPVLLGGGTLFFDFIGQQQRLHLKDVTTYKDGMVELQYQIKKD